MRHLKHVQSLYPQIEDAAVLYPQRQVHGVLNVQEHLFGGFHEWGSPPINHFQMGFSMI